uniref:Uncharacterized protein n=1 Tax=viral metagenome TaxID=1070528 RepID=A0A6M3K027_9ZZZZ
MKMTAEDKKWRARDDAYTLIAAESIQLDKTRKNAAMKEVNRIALEKAKEAAAAMKVAKPTKPTPKSRSSRSRKK